MPNPYKFGGAPCPVGTAGPTNPPFTGPGPALGPTRGGYQPLLVDPNDACCPPPPSCCGPGSGGGPGGGNRPGGGQYPRG